MSSNLNNNDLIEAGACPNCWGKQEYADQFVQYQEDRDRNVVNMDKTAKKAFIQTFVQDNMTGIQLKKEGYQLVCPKCKKGYGKA